MATCFNFGCLPISRFFIALGLFCVGSTLIHIRSMDREFGRIADFRKVVKVVGNVYHSTEVFRMNYAEMERKFKIYVYPDEDDEDSTNYETISVKYASEGYFFKNLKESSFLTLDPNRADLFFIPISCHKMHQKVSSYEEMQSIIGKHVDGLIHKYPYWNKSLGADHFFLTCHEIDVRATEGVPLLVKNAIRVVCSAAYNTGFIPHKDVSLPLVLQPFTEAAGGNDIPRRTTLGYWAGISNTEVRETLVDLWEGNGELDIQSKKKITHEAGRMTKFYTSKFCICPAGSRLTSNRITMAIHYGCVPVILADYYELPFNDVLDWRRFSVILKERDVYQLRGILKDRAVSDFRVLHRNLMKVQRHFRWNSPTVKYDAFHMVLYDLWLRRNVVKY